MRASALTRTRAPSPSARVGVDLLVSRKPAEAPPALGPLPPAARTDDGTTILVAPEVTSGPSTIVLLGREVDCGKITPSKPLNHGGAAAPASDGTSTQTYDKFADPWFHCFSNVGYVADNALAKLLRVRNDFAYLADVPPEPVARIRAMRGKVNALGDKKTSTAVTKMRENSQEAIRKIGLNLLSLYRDPARHDELVATYQKIYQRGLDEITADAAKIDQIVKMSPPELQQKIGDLLRQAKPLVEEVQRGVREFASRVTGGSVSETSALFSSLSSAVPIAGAIIGLASALYADIRATLAADVARARANCQGSLGEGDDYMRATLDRGFPIPWHALDFDLDCSKAVDEFAADPEGVLAFRAAMYNNLVRLYCLPLAAQELIIRWWAHASAMMSHEEVAKIFTALGNDGTFGGMLASDEQVLLVGAPIAVANGWDPYAFAAALWERSKGWSSRPPGFPNMLRREPDWPIAVTSLKDPRVYISDDPCLKGQPNNAMQVQWAILANDAFALADEIKTGKPTALMSVTRGEILGGGLSSSEKTQAGIGTVAIVGGIALGAVMLFGGK